MIKLATPSWTVFSPTELSGLRRASDRNSKFYHAMANTISISCISEAFSDFGIGKIFSKIESFDFFSCWKFGSSDGIRSIKPIGNLLKLFRLVSTAEAYQFMPLENIVSSIYRDVIDIFSRSIFRIFSNCVVYIKHIKTLATIINNRSVSVGGLEKLGFAWPSFSIRLTCRTIAIKETRKPSAHEVNTLGHVHSIS